MKRRDMILAMFVMLLWGINFTVIKFGVNEMSPMLLVALRYIFTALPAIAFVKRPDIRWKYIITYGMTVGVGQFSCLFYAEHIGMPAGIASVVLQSQAFFTIIFASMLFKERIKISQALGLLVAGIGLFFISGNIGIHDTPVIPIGAFFLTLAAAFFWGVSNIIIRYASKEADTLGKSLNMFGMVVWSSLIPPIPMLLISLALDKPKVVWHEITNIHALALFSILYLALFATLIGYGIWSTLLSKYPAGKVAPLSLLVPVVGLITAQLFLREELSAIQWMGGFIIVLGLMIANFSSLISKYSFKRK